MKGVCKMSFRKSLAVVIAALLIIFVLTGCSEEEEPGISEIDWGNNDLRAEQFVKALLNGDFSIAAAGFDEEMNRALGVRGLRNAWRSTVRAAGEFESLVGTEVIPNDEYDIYHVVTLHKNRDINSRVVFSNDGLIAGLFFSFIDN